MSANVRQDGSIRQLDRPAEPDENIVESDVTDTGRLVRLLMRILRTLAAIQRRWWPRHIDFEDQAVTSGSSYRFPHRFKGRVRWWVVDWSGSGASAVFKRDTTSSDENTLVLTAGATGIATIRCEEAG